MARILFSAQMPAEHLANAGAAWWVLIPQHRRYRGHQSSSSLNPVAKRHSNRGTSLRLGDLPDENFSSLRVPVK